MSDSAARMIGGFIALGILVVFLRWLWVTVGPEWPVPVMEVWVIGLMMDGGGGVKE